MRAVRGVENSGGDDWLSHLNPSSLEVLEGCKAEHLLGDAGPGDRFQFERLGYFCADKGSSSDQPLFNRTVTLRDTWAKIEKARKKGNRG